MDLNKLGGSGMNRRIEVIKGDITKLHVDVIVNAANNTLLGGGGVDGAIHEAAGRELLDECKLLGGCETGKAKITKGYRLPAKFVIHTVGPIWHNGTCNESQLLRECYLNSIELAIENNLKTIAFPSISTGVYQYPADKAVKIAYQAVKDMLDSHSVLELEKVYFVCFNDLVYDLYSKME